MSIIDKRKIGYKANVIYNKDNTIFNKKTIRQKANKMYIKNLVLNNFKNFESLQFDFSSLNCIIGNNGKGKTNILDAIYYLSFCRSFLASKDIDVINYDKDFFSLKGTFVNDEDLTNEYLISQKKGERKTLKHDKQPYKKLSEHIGKIPCVVISPLDHIYITGRSEQRRKFMDVCLSQTDVVYMDTLINYNKCLEQRNKLLKNFQLSGIYDSIQMDIWTEKLSSLSDIIKAKRKDFFEEFSAPFQHYYQFVSNSNETPSVVYKTYENNLLDILHRDIERDKILGYTNNGVHRDDLIFYLNNHDVNHIASQGQQKTFLVALKLAQFDYIKTHKSITPILLLDDIFDKFDFERVQKVIRLVVSQDLGQVFITDTHLSRVKDIIPENKKNDSTIIEL